MYAFFGNMSRHILKQLEMDVHACPCLCMYATLCFESVLEQRRQFLLVSECVCVHCIGMLCCLQGDAN
jgi:hypothetical protein